jgi:predicted RNA-binding Zn-ribbon protein involved in translation (DUF1610 family)
MTNQPPHLRVESVAGLEPCRACGQELAPHFVATVLERHQVAYGRCPNCGLIQTQEPYWLAEAYDQAISCKDVGLVRRNLELRDKLRDVIMGHFPSRGRFLDYAGGYGLLVRLMRDEGFDFYRHDPLCANIFAQDFDIELPAQDQFTLITAFELLEHLRNPGQVLRDLLTHTDSVLFSTRLQPRPQPLDVRDWWYFCPQSGQHITFYTLASLRHLATATGTALHTDGKGLHLLTRCVFARNPLEKPRGLLPSLERRLHRWKNWLRKHRYAGKMPESLLPADAGEVVDSRADKAVLGRP